MAHNVDTTGSNVKDMGQELRDSIKMLNELLDTAWDENTAKALKYKAEALLALAETYDILEGGLCDQDHTPNYGTPIPWQQIPTTPLPQPYWGTTTKTWQNGDTTYTLTDL